MIAVNSLSLSPGEDEKVLKVRTAAVLHISPARIKSLKILKKSLDARKKSDVHYIYSVAVGIEGDESKLLRRRDSRISTYEPFSYVIPKASGNSRPVVVGFGPGGMFAALVLAEAGLRPIVLERGKSVEDRAADVARFWAGGGLSPDSNVQFGEGGAGTFSDGKLNTGTHDRRIGWVLEKFREFGAPECVTYDSRPHVGTDVLAVVVKNLRLRVIALGGDVRFGHKLTGIKSEGGRICGCLVESPDGNYSLTCSELILAPGHSARDTFAMLLDSGMAMEQKPIAIGVRIEHRQSAISASQYGEVWKSLPPASYKLVCHLPSGRNVFSFCVCPGGQVVAAASGDGQVVTNGMSLSARDGENINGGLLVGINTSDYDGGDALAGVRFQEKWERAAWSRSEGRFLAPAQLVGDFLEGRPSMGAGAILPSYRPGVVWGELEGVLPDYVLDSLRLALPELDKKLRGFADPEAVLTGVETRSSSPVRILRGENLESVSLSGLFPCGEGAGYAGGITSAAVDGMKCAEMIIERYAL